MRLLLYKYKIVVLSVLLMTGIYITVWAFIVHFDKKAKGAESQRELKHDNQVANVIPSVLDRNNMLLVLVCIGLVGFFGVRRPGKTFQNLVWLKSPESRSRTDSINENDPERQTCQDKLDIPDKQSCQLNTPCCV